MGIMAPAQFLGQTDIPRSLKRWKDGDTGGPKPNLSWRWWARSSDLGMYGGSRTCATETAEVSDFIFLFQFPCFWIGALGQLEEHLYICICEIYFLSEHFEVNTSLTCRCVLHPIHLVHVYLWDPFILPWNCRRTVYQPGGDYVLEKDLPAFSR